MLAGFRSRLVSVGALIDFRKIVLFMLLQLGEDRLHLLLIPAGLWPAQGRGTEVGVDYIIVGCFVDDDDLSTFVRSIDGFD